MESVWNKRKLELELPFQHSELRFPRVLHFASQNILCRGFCQDFLTSINFWKGASERTCLRSLVLIIDFVEPFPTFCQLSPLSKFNIKLKVLFNSRWLQTLVYPHTSSLRLLLSRKARETNFGWVSAGRNTFLTSFLSHSYISCFPDLVLLGLWRSICDLKNSRPPGEHQVLLLSQSLSLVLQNGRGNHGLSSYRQQVRKQKSFAGFPASSSLPFSWLYWPKHEK